MWTWAAQAEITYPKNIERKQDMGACMAQERQRRVRESMEQDYGLNVAEPRYGKEIRFYLLVPANTGNRVLRRTVISDSFPFLSTFQGDP